VKPAPIVQYWHRENTPNYIEELFATFRKHNPDRPHLVFNETSAADFIAINFGPREADAFGTCAVPATQADYFRICAMYAGGGMWCDADSRCDAPLGRLMNVTGGELFEISASSTGAVNNAFLIFESPGHPFLELALEIATTGIEARTPKFVAGPEVLSALVTSRRLGSFDALLSACRGISERPRQEHASERLLLWHLRQTLENIEDGHLDLLRELIDVTRLAEACEGIRVSPPTKLHGLITHHPWPLPYKESNDHHAHFKGSIYRPKARS
jgi:glycosyl transferase-like sugar-binding protein